MWVLGKYVIDRYLVPSWESLIRTIVDFGAYIGTLSFMETTIW